MVEGIDTVQNEDISVYFISFLTKKYIFPCLIDCQNFIEMFFEKFERSTLLRRKFIRYNTEMIRKKFLSHSTYK